MKVIIDNFICFDDVDNTLTNVSTNDKISLPLTASLIFAYMISRQGDIIDRNELFENVWVKYGQNPSNNTLTQYISLIRRNLNALGLPAEMIVTIPKIGFRIPLDVEIIHPPSEDEVLHQPKDQYRTFSTVTLLIVFVIIFSMMIVTAIYYWRTYRIAEQDTYHLGYYKNCEIRSLSAMTVAQTKDSVDRTRKYAPNYLPCYGNAIYYIGVPHIAPGNKSSRFFLGQCMTEKDNVNHFTSCRSIYFYE
ncbi:TPA: winged helix-turn-helix domain-containing protein [Citrobacter freundii]|uniref:winged helix-turn-helix domain-containing protein n=1 Tax=Citrobacter freundii TaxID=546 RepID=UPI00383A68E4|nr:winged helix-turn-helix domain-containing protein [Citrobacter freundii]